MTTLGRDVLLGSHTARMLHAGVTWQIHNDFAVLLEELAAEDFGKEISRVRLARNVANANHSSTAELPHLEHLTIHVARVLCRREPVAKVISSLAVRMNVDRVRCLETKEVDQLKDMQQLNRTISECD